MGTHERCKKIACTSIHRRHILPRHSDRQFSPRRAFGSVDLVESAQLQAVISTVYMEVDWLDSCQDQPRYMTMSWM